jgi:uncharacterized protein Yka (UPF0111/DUF47 family)
VSDDSEFLRRRLDAIQTELGTMRLRDEQREAAYQSQTQTLTRQIVEIAASVDKHLAAMSERIENVNLELTRRLAAVDSKLTFAAERFEERMDRLEELVNRRAL